ncbi:MAG: hypothetical protein ACOX04_02595 [Candidatus Scatomorpha sp.]|jgi:hypothetical protein
MNKRKTLSVSLAVLILIIIVFASIVVLVLSKDYSERMSASPEPSAQASDPGAAPTDFIEESGFETQELKSFFTSTRVYPASNADLERVLPSKLCEDLTLSASGFVNGLFLESSPFQVGYNILAIKVKNTGERLIKSATIIVPTDEETAVFKIAYLPPGTTAIVMEESASDYTGRLYLSRVEVTELLFPEEGEVLSDMIEMFLDGSRIRLKNISNAPITFDLKLHFKYKLGSDYFGGRDFFIPISGGFNKDELKELNFDFITDAELICVTR